ncbi:hypothetical protein L1887_32730 [Cichorium endivia]|nr:hypothetical protein L1887_32730 [Cichorium endivia]
MRNSAATSVKPSKEDEEKQNYYRNRRLSAGSDLSLAEMALSGMRGLSAFSFRKLQREFSSFSLTVIRPDNWDHFEYLKLTYYARSREITIEGKGSLRTMYEFQTDLHTICVILAYGRGRNAFMSWLHSSATTTGTTANDKKQLKPRIWKPKSLQTGRNQEKKEARTEVDWKR